MCVFFFAADESAWLASASDSVNNSTSAGKTQFPQSRSAVLSMFKALETQARNCGEQLVARLHSHLTHLLTNALGTGGVATDAGTGAAGKGCCIACIKWSLIILNNLTFAFEL